jgi:hypothetical protein
LERSCAAHLWRGILALVLNERLISVVRQLISGKFVLNQQNGVLNPPGGSYNQGAWHRDFSSEARDLLGFNCLEPQTIAEYIERRRRKD